MCGICGYYSEHHPLTEDVLRRVNDSLLHRGPDAGEVIIEKNAGLGNRRLRILDLSDAGNQPMHSSCGRYVMVYNGEVYNYKQLQQEHLSGRPLRSGNDTETLLELYAKLGVDALPMLNGMFALAIYDRKENTLLLARDCGGIKPLYFHYDHSGTLYFASEINAFRHIPGLSLRINKAVVPLFLHLGYIPAPQSIYRNVYKLRPGHYLEFNGRQLTENRFEPLVSGNNTMRADPEGVCLEETLLDSIRLQLQSDVPSGIFLSGGIDSSLLTALATKVSTAPLKTFSIGFRESRFDESEYARRVAEKLGTDHHPFIVSMDDATELFDKVTDIYGEPFADSSAIPTLMVSKLAKDSVTVTLSGEGGDELFMGYGTYKWARRMAHPLLRFSRPALRSLLRLSGGSRNKRVAELLDFNRDTFTEGHIFSQEQYFFSEKELLRATTTGPGVREGWFRDYLNEIQPDWPAAVKQSRFDRRYYLPDDLLVKVDRASMNYSLEVRVPYLDPRVIALADRMPENMKWRNGETKYILKKILFRHLPAELFSRPKQGFALPLESWLKERWEEYIQKYLAREVILHYGMVKYEAVQELLERYRRPGNAYLYNRIWALIALHRWLRRFHP
ncbi:MAG: asparagine synthase (glutamine-hydrolyzing) [Bacteroidia bacterium]|nr:asparagine synthase (glutamine-hydrolyzing) [Bacteroidia bacterium]